VKMETVNHEKFRKYLDFSTPDNVYIMTAMTRKKDGSDFNTGSSDYRHPRLVKRLIIRNTKDYDECFRELEIIAEALWATFRIYITFNPRSLRKAYSHLMQHTMKLLLENNTESFYTETSKFDSRFKSFLDKDSGKAKTKYHMLDVDCKEVPFDVINQHAEVVDVFPTKNGSHVLIKPTNPKSWEGLEDVEFKHDNLLLLKYKHFS